MHIHTCANKMHNSTIILENSLVSSKLDYCNSLYYGLSAVSLDRLQKVQNSLARVVDPSVRVTTILLPHLKNFIGFLFISVFISKLPLSPSKHFKTFNLPTCPISLLRTLLLETFDPLTSIFLQCLTFVQLMVAVHLLSLLRLSGTHYLLHFVSALLYTRFSLA